MKCLKDCQLWPPTRYRDKKLSSTKTEMSSTKCVSKSKSFLTAILFTATLLQQAGKHPMGSYFFKCINAIVPHLVKYLLNQPQPY